MRSDRRSDRAVIPRWRPLPAIGKDDLKPSPRRGFVPVTHVSADLHARIDLWRQEDDLSSAIDIFDAAILTQDWRLLKEARDLLTKRKEQLPPRIVDALRRSLTPPDDPIQKRRLLAHWERDLKYVKSSIRVYKARVQRHPRDALAHVELARLYTVLAQVDQAESHLAIARAIAPNDRYILRATLRYYDFRDDLWEGLKILRRAERLKYDPWLQSAELAAATLLGKHSRVPKRPEIALTSEGSVARTHSELAMALATRDLESGVTERKIFQAVRRALPMSTENGIAQAVWLSDMSSKGFNDRFPENKPNSEANEANVQLAVDRKDFQFAADQAELWLEDQPFSRDALIKYLNLRAVHVGPDQSSIRWAKHALQIHNDDWQVMNAVVLLLSEAGENEAATRALEFLKKKAPRGSKEEAFIYAAEGFLAFSQYDFAVGRASYEKAVDIARTQRSQPLVIDALMFWLRCEAKCNLISKSFFSKIAKSFMSAIKKIPVRDRGFLEGVWHSIENNVSLPENDLPEGEQNPIFHTVSLALENIDKEPQLALA